MADALRKAKKNTHGKAKGPRRGSRRVTTVRVGKEWTRDELDVVARDRRVRTSAAIGLGALFALMLAGFWLYALWSGDSGLRDKVFALVQLGLFAVMAWAFGPRLFRLVSGVRFDDPDDEERDEKYQKKEKWS